MISCEAQGCTGFAEYNYLSTMGKAFKLCSECVQISVNAVSLTNRKNLGDLVMPKVFRLSDDAQVIVRATV